MARKNNELRFLKTGGDLTLIAGHKAKAANGREMFRSSSGQTYEAYKTLKLDEITPEQKERFVNSYNDMLRRDFDFQQAKDPNESMKFRVYTFDEIVISYIDDLKNLY